MSDVEHLFIYAADGLKLHVCAHGPRGRQPVVCLPGLSRSADDFEPLANALAGDADRPRQVFAVDYRGRGLSEHDRNPENYNVAVELADLLAVLTALEIERAVFVGTSRGGILTMLLATVRPAVIAGAVLNDIGPVIEMSGLLRIKSYVGKLPHPASFEQASEGLRQLFGTQFPKLSPQEWMAFARRTFEQHDGTMRLRYDPRLADTLAELDGEKPLPSMWKEFDALATVPTMVIRGANSDLLSAATVAAMRERRPDLQLLEVPDQGHAPMLAEHDVIERICAFVAHCEEPA